MKGSQIWPNRPEFCDAFSRMMESGVTRNRTHIHLAIGSRFIEAMKRHDQTTHNTAIRAISPSKHLLRLADYLTAELRSASRLLRSHLISAVIPEIRWVKLIRIIDR